MDDDDKPRRNLMVISILFITYSLAGGSIDDHITYMKLARPEMLEYIALVMFAYFYWAFWVTHREEVRKFLARVTARMMAYQEQFIPLVETALKSAVPQDNTKKLALARLIEIFRQHKNAPTPIKVPGEILNWKVKYHGEVTLVGPNKQYNVELDLTGVIQPDALMLLWLKALVVESYTTSSFKDIILPYAIALVAISITIARFLIH